jgi:hypothetical protein
VEWVGKGQHDVQTQRRAEGVSVGREVPFPK